MPPLAPQGLTTLTVKQGLAATSRNLLGKVESCDIYRTRLPWTLARRAREGGKPLPRLRFGLA